MLARFLRWLGAGEVHGAPIAAPEPPSAGGAELLQLRSELLELRRTVDAQASALLDVRKEFDELNLEWAGVLSKIKRWANREAARTRHDAEKALDQIHEPAAPAEPVQVQDVRAMTKAQLRQLAHSLKNGGTQ